MTLVAEANDAIPETVGWNRKPYLKMVETDKTTYISAPRQDSWTIQNVITMFRTGKYNSTYLEMLKCNRMPSIQYGGRKIGSAHISACRQDGGTKSNAITMFSHTGNTIQLVWRHANVTGRRKSKMAVAKPEVHISQPIDKIAGPAYNM